MPNTPNANLNFSVQQQNVSTPTTGVVFVMGETKRGPINDPKDIITSWRQFVSTFGGYLPLSTFPLLCQRILDKGGILRVSRLAHYDDPSTPSTLTALKASEVIIEDVLGNKLFKLIPKWAGADFNNVSFEICAATNGSANFFNLKLTHSLEPSLNELYENLSIPIPYPDNAHSQYLTPVVKGSALVDVEYQDLSLLYTPGSGVTPRLVPVDVVGNFSGGDNGDPVVDTDYIGDQSAGIGFYSFDKYTESYGIAAPDQSSTAIHVAGDAYAAKRQDLRYYAHLDNSNTTVASLKAERSATNIDSKFTRFYAGGLKVTNPLNGQPLSISELGDVLGSMVSTQNSFKPWFSYAGQQRGIIQKTLGVVNNFGSPAQFADMNLLANAQINMVINRSEKVMIWGNFSAQLSDNLEKFNNVNDLEIYLIKMLTPVFEFELESPCDFPLFSRLYYTAKPKMDEIVRGQGMYKYEWNGDQFASDFSQLQVNIPNDISNGNYHIDLKIWPTPSTQSISVNISLQQGGGVQVVPSI